MLPSASIGCQPPRDISRPRFGFKEVDGRGIVMYVGPLTRHNGQRGDKYD